MKKITLILSAFLLVFGSGLSGQNLVTITLNVGQMNNPDCWLNGGNVASNKVYIHSGLCVSNPTFCNDSIQGFGSPIWEHVAGNWGMDDGLGEMVYQGNGVWDITLDLDTYHSPPNGSTPYVMGLVFRNFDGSYEGKDDQCGDIFIKGLDGNNLSVVQGSTGAPFPAVTAMRTTAIKRPAVLANLSLSPNPSKGMVQIRYELKKKAQALTADVYNSLGQHVDRLHEGVQQPGTQALSWEGEEAGLYYIALRDGNELLATEKILIQK